MLDERLLKEEFGETSFLGSYNSEHSNNSFFISLDKLNMENPIKRLGSGGVGSVYQTLWNGMIVAVKVFDLNDIQITEDDFMIEASLLSKLRHPNVINFFGISSSPTKRYIIMECLEKSLDRVVSDLQRENCRYTLEEKLTVLSNIGNGIEYLHTMTPKRIAHRDLKPGNILLDSNGVCKLCDFGLSKMMSQHTLSALTNQVGTCYYMSPEVSDVHEVDSTLATALDIYSFAIIMWQILFEVVDPYMSTDVKVLKKLGLKEPPHYQSMFHLHRCISESGTRPSIPFTSMEGCLEWCETYLPNQSKQTYQVLFEMCELIKQCWDQSPQQRPSIQTIIQHLNNWAKCLQ